MKNSNFIRTSIGIIFCVFILQLVPAEGNQSASVNEVLTQLTQDDRSILEKEFSELILWSSFGYTLFGDKPLSFEIRPSLEKFWSVWEKNKSSLQLNDFILSKFHQGNHCGVLIANKKAILLTCENSKGLFEDVLGISDPENLVLEVLEKGSGDVFDQIFRNDEILGVLLGYGKENSAQFQRRKKLKAFHKPNLVWELWIKHSKSLLPQFAANLETEETKKLKTKYLKQRKMIEKQYRNGDALKVTLNRLCQ